MFITLLTTVTELTGKEWRLELTGREGVEARSSWSEVEGPWHSRQDLKWGHITTFRALPLGLDSTTNWGKLSKHIPMRLFYIPTNRQPLPWSSLLAHWCAFCHFSFYS